MGYLLRVIGILMVCTLLYSLSLFRSIQEEEEQESLLIDDWNLSKTRELESGHKQRSHFITSMGAEDKPNNFIQSVEESVLPHYLDLTPNELLQSHSFDTGSTSDTSCTDPLCPSTSLALSTDPLLDCMKIDCKCGEEQIGQAYVAVKLEVATPITDRKKLNLVLVVDISKAMRTHFDHGDKTGPSKFDVLADGLPSLFSSLRPKDQVSIVLMSDKAVLATKQQKVGTLNTKAIVKHLRDLQSKGDMSFIEGLDKACTFIAENFAPEKRWMNRVVVFFAAGPTEKGSDVSIIDKLTGYASIGIGATFVGLNTGLDPSCLEKLSALPEMGHYKATSAHEFRQLMTTFDALVTPLVSNLQLYAKPRTDGITVDAIYRNSGFLSTTYKHKDHPEIELSTSTLFVGQMPQNLILIKLRHLQSSEKHRKVNRSACMITADGRTVVWNDDRSPVEEELGLQLSYEDHSGAKVEKTWHVPIHYGNPPRFDSPGVRKAVLLQRYAQLLRSWLLDAWDLALIEYNLNGQPLPKNIKHRLRVGHELPANLKSFEHNEGIPFGLSFGLRAFEDYTVMMSMFLRHFCDEAVELKDPQLLKEGMVLYKLIAFGKAEKKHEVSDCVQKLIEKGQAQ